MNASNTGKRLSASSMGYQTLDDSSENLGKKSPRFMSPTVSSTKQTHSRPSGHVGTPSPLNPSTRARASGNWMSSAAKRVGLNRVNDRTPRSKKEALARQPKAISFPDKFTGPPYASVPNPSTSRSATPKFDKATLDAKPLPSPPVAQIMMAGPLKQNRTLIDASEKPLRRSPPGKPQEEEAWPVLYPNRPTTPGTLRQMTPERDGVLATTDNIHQPTERYPRLPSMGTYESTLDMERKASPRIAGQQIQRKQVSSPNLRKTSTGLKSVTSGQEKGRQGATPLNVKKNDQPDSPSLEAKLPASTVAFNDAHVDNEKPVNTRPSSEPRQTRTSSLRARMSAGTATNENMKPNGNKAADATTATEPLATEKDIKRRSTPKPPGAFPVGRKLSRDSLRGKKPAQFVAGSRRPSSRGSLRSDSRASSTTAQPRSEKVVSDDTGPSMVASLGQSLDTVNTVDKGPEIAPRRSSIPVFTHTISNVETPADKIGESKSIDAINAPASAEEFTIFEDNIESHPIGSLDAIEESPHQGYHVRRLSLISPEHGPTLKISPSADRIIMGTGSDKENDEPKKSRNKTRVPAPRDGSSSRDKPAHLTKTKHPKQTRPLSSLGILQSTSRRGTVDSDARSKKVKSAEITPSPSLAYSSTLNSRTPNTSRKTTDTSNEDPFFDAQSSIDQRISRLDHQTANAIAVEEPAWVAPVHNHLNLTADSDAVLNPSDVQSMLTHEENHTDSVTADILSMMYKEDEIQECNLEATQPVSTDDAPVELPADDTLVNGASIRLTEATPTTPEHSTTAAGSSNFDSLPPRSSSRTTHPDFISNKHSPTSPLGNKEPVSKDFTDRQNRLGSLGGHATAQVDSAYPASNRKSARNSVACESNVSQGSISKGVFSNIKGLFHKRSSDEPVKSGKKHKQQKASTASNGSPFPPISEVHPAHRPTLSSARHINTHGLTPKSSMPTLGTNVMLSPPVNSPAPSELATTTTMAMQILESARKERSSPKKERLLELGKILVDALTQARDAEKALEEAKQAARKAEVSYELCKRSVSQVKKVVEQWREELKGGASR